MRISDWSSDVCSSDLPDWRAISRVMRLPVALIMIRTFLERRQQRLHGFARDLDGARGGRIGLLKAQQVARFPVAVDLAHLRPRSGGGIGARSRRGVPCARRRSVERRVGEECGDQVRLRWGPSHTKKKPVLHKKK